MFISILFTNSFCLNKSTADEIENKRTPSAIISIKNHLLRLNNSRTRSHMSSIASTLAPEA
ncbi:hypothetical protein LZT09_02160, partial [Vibrio fluvialis]|uniref:hypothetical protein n=1 Tax=Vibrio fluvialis TaxID=676 RepID=UPI001F39082C